MQCAESPAALLISILIPLLCAGCLSSSPLDSAEAGKSSSYLAGSPVFDIETGQTRGDSNTAVDIYLSVPHPSLIFEKVAGGFRSRCEITARLSDRASEELMQEVEWAETTFVERYEATQTFEPAIFWKRISALPRSYRVEITLEDLVDGRKASRVQGLFVRDPADECPALGRICLLARERDGTTHPQISFFVPARSDSTGCTLEAYNLPASSDSRIEMRVIRFAGDTSAALPPFFYALLPIPLGHRLIDFNEADTAFSAARSVRASHRDETLEFRIPPLRQGMYRIDCTALTRTAEGRDTALFASRYYSIKGPGFPRPVTFGELIDAAVYIATEKEMKDLRQARSPDEQRQKFEAFWLSLAGDPVRASAMIKKYYGRVEEANRLFTIVREGWRTDRGMLYCVLGPPGGIDNDRDTQIWRYDFPGSAQENTFVFKSVVKVGDGVTVQDFLLYREGGYQQFWDRMVAKWRGGEPL